MEIINSIFSWIIKKRIHQIDLFKKHPIEVQNELLFSLIQRAMDTEWGEKQHYKSIQSIKEFKQRFPVQDYDSIKPYIDRIMKGEEDVLWPGEVKWFAKSSGTTSDRSKFIPITKESLEECHYKGGKDMLSIYANLKPDTNIYGGKSLVVGGSNQVNKLNENSSYGDLSAIIIKNLPFWVQLRRTPGMQVALMEEWEEKIKRMVEEIVHEDVRSISGVPSWTLILLQNVLAKTGKTSIHEVWPNLEMFFHGGVSFKPYREQFHNIIHKNKMHYLETYNASEGFFGIQDELNTNELLLMLDYGIFYEFLPIDQWERDCPDTIGLEEVKLGQNYAVVISTNGGLWRYKIGDTVQFTCLNPFRIQITGRTKHFINAFGEELIIDNVEKALVWACGQTSAHINEYTAGPVFIDRGSKGAHEWVIEFAQFPDDQEKFNALLDEKLRELNSDYDAKRHKDLALRKPIIHAVKDKTFYSWMKNRGKLGGQNKVPRLSNDRQYLDEILKLLKDI